MKLGLSNEGQDEIINRSYDFAEIAYRHASSIFMEGYTSAIMQAIFNPPIGAGQVEQMLR